MEFLNTIDSYYQRLIQDKVIYPKIKIELLDQYEHSYRELIEDISSENVGSISCQYQQGVRKTCNFTIFDPSLTFLPNPNDDYFWINKKFKIYVGLAKKKPIESEYNLSSSKSHIIVEQKIPEINPDPKLTVRISAGPISDIDEDIYWFSKGVFIITNVSVQDNEGKIINISGVDKFGAFGNETGYGEMTSDFSLPKGEKIKDILENLLSQDIGNGVQLDPKPPIIEPFFQDYKIPVNINKGPGAYLGDLLKELGSTLQADIFYDNDGHLNFRRTLNYEKYHSLKKAWDFKYGDSEYISPSLSYDIQKIANCICVVGDNPSASNLPVARVENNSPYSPFAIQKIGRKTKYKESSFIQTALEAEQYANYLLKQYSINGQTIQFSTTFMPHLDVDEIISITDKNYNYTNQDFIISSLEIPIGLGETRISASNISKLPLTD